MTLDVELIDNRDIVVSNPLAGFSVTYRKDGDAPILVGRFPDPARVRFWAEAWRAAHRKAVAIGWLNS